VFVQRAIWSASTQEGLAVNDEISFQSAEGLRFTSDVNASYQLTAAHVPDFYVRFRNDDLNARNYFQLERTRFNRNLFGGTLGGPIHKDKTFSSSPIRDRAALKARSRPY